MCHASEDKPEKELRFAREVYDFANNVTDAMNNLGLKDADMSGIQHMFGMVLSEARVFFTFNNSSYRKTPWSSGRLIITVFL